MRLSVLKIKISLYKKIKHNESEISMTNLEEEDDMELKIRAGETPPHCKSCGNYSICIDYNFSSYQPDEHGMCVGWHSKKDHVEDMA